MELAEVRTHLIRAYGGTLSIHGTEIATNRVVNGWVTLELGASDQAHYKSSWTEQRIDSVRIPKDSSAAGWLRSQSEERFWCPRQESNLRPWFRRPMLYPLSYEGML